VDADEGAVVATGLAAAVQPAATSANASTAAEAWRGMGDLLSSLVEPGDDGDRNR
jgi:hypothetical protein